MTQSEALARLRIILDETTASFWADADLYKLIDSGQNEVANHCLTVERVRQKLEPMYAHPTLEPLLTTVTQNLVSGTVTYTISGGFGVTDVKEIYLVRIKYAGAFYPATRVARKELFRRELGTYTAPSTTDPIFHFESGQIVISPSPTGNVTGGLSMTYYKNPTAVASGQDFTLRSETHEACIEYAAWKALEKDGEYQEAMMHENKFNQILSQL